MESATTNFKIVYTEPLVEFVNGNEESNNGVYLKKVTTDAPECKKVVMKTVEPGIL